MKSKSKKPLLTRREIESDLSIDDGGTKLYTEPAFTAAINTIEAMAELLERWLQVNQVSSHGVVKATHDLLKTFNVTGGGGGACLPESK